ncbi:MAG: hypothetical protein KDD29_10560 [Flavobacteriales bacterium]|nr:hypothetical protein [Flavobacteriales bacterium]
MKILLKFKSVSVTRNGDYYQIMFSDDLDVEGEPYFMIQRQFEFPDGGVCSFESHNEELIDTCKAKSLSLTKDMLRIRYGDKENHEVDISYNLQETNFQELSSTLKEMIPITKIDV